ncbi:MAG TPA: hypothetical protein P5556_10720 [Candidatus Gastranaerophilales bacterium]|nr:hypothetical protein [Candidatus Gastranaerophilales bacterium]
MEKGKIAEKFLKSLENPQDTMNIMLDRIDSQTLLVINDYANLISKVKNRTSLEENDIISCSIIIGYLLKGHLDRYDLDQNFHR